MIENMNTENEYHSSGYFSIIPSNVLYSKTLKPNEKLLYAIITSLSNKEGYCYASNKYLGDRLEVDHKTASRWISNLAKNNYLVLDYIYNDNKEFLQRRIYPNVTPYLSNNHYPHPPKNHEASDEKIEVNNINYNNINIHTETKKKFLSNIYLYDFEYQELTNKYGETKTNKCIEFLSLYKASKGVEYESDYATILRWVADAVDEKEQRQERNKNQGKKNNRLNYEQREYPPEFFESLYDNIPSPTSTNTEEDEMDLDM